MESHPYDSFINDLNKILTNPHQKHLAHLLLVR